MSFAAWLTVGVTAAAVIAMAREWLEPPLALGGALGLLLIGGVITPAEGLAGFSNPAVATVALFILLGRENDARLGAEQARGVAQRAQADEQAAREEVERSPESADAPRGIARKTVRSVGSPCWPAPPGSSSN